MYSCKHKTRANIIDNQELKMKYFSVVYQRQKKMKINVRSHFKISLFAHLNYRKS